MKWLLLPLGAVCLMLFTSQLYATTRYVDLNCANPTPPYTDWTTAATNIQGAINAAGTGDTVIVTNGVYQSGSYSLSGLNRVYIYKNLTVQSVNGPEFTTIQGYQIPGTTNGSTAIRCVYLSSGTTLSGFMLTNGATGTTTVGGSGGGAYCQADALLTNCVITGNVADNFGGGIYCESTNTVVEDCVITDNAAFEGGGTFKGTLNGCKLLNNSASANGGGASHSKLTNCKVTRNRATEGGGVFFSSLNSCTVVSNSANTGGGVYDNNNDVPYGRYTNCIIYYNMASTGSNYALIFIPSNALNFCCTLPLPTGATGNITNEPLFANLSSDGYYLQSNSPCINSGNNASVTSATDLDGNPRIIGGTVDMGAYEYQAPSSILSYAWTQQYGLPTDGSADNTDSDGDGLNNWQEWKAGTVPTNAASVLQLTSPTNSVSGMVVTWQSVSGITYYLQRSSDLARGFSSIVSNRMGQAGSTSYTDTSATNGGPYFYRIGVQ